jgi:hypothetical protein
MFRMITALACSALCVAMPAYSQIPRHLEINEIDTDPGFEHAAACFGLSSQYYLTLLAVEAAEGLSMMGTTAARRDVLTWEHYLVTNLGAQSSQVRDTYQNRIYGGQEFADQTIAEGGLDDLRELIWQECSSYMSGRQVQGLDPIDAGVRFPLKQSATQLTQKDRLRCLGAAEAKRFMEGPIGLIRSNGWRQLYSDWIASGGYDAAEVSARTDDAARREFENLYRLTVVANLDGTANPGDEAEAFCAAYETN